MKAPGIKRALLNSRKSTKLMGSKAYMWSRFARRQHGPNIDRLTSLIAERIGSVDVKLDVPTSSSGTWWIDIEALGGRLTIAWSRETGYGFFLEDDAGYGDRPHKYISKVELAARLAARVFERHATHNAADIAWDESAAVA